MSEHTDSEHAKGKVALLYFDRSQLSTQMISIICVSLALVENQYSSNVEELLSDEHCPKLARKLRMQAAQNHLNQLDMGAFGREIEDVAKRLEGRPDLLAQFQLPWLKSIFPVQIRNLCNIFLQVFGRTSAPGLPPKWRKCLTTPSATWRRIELILKEQSADAEHSRWSFIFARSHNPHNHHTSCWQPSPELVERAMEKNCLISLLMDHDNIFLGYCFPESLLLIRILGTDLSLMIFPKFFLICLHVLFPLLLHVLSCSFSVPCLPSKQFTVPTIVRDVSPCIIS